MEPKHAKIVEKELEFMLAYPDITTGDAKAIKRTLKHLRANYLPPVGHLLNPKK
jgi:hypothetical protein